MSNLIPMTRTYTRGSFIFRCDDNLMASRLFIPSWGFNCVLKSILKVIKFHNQHHHHHHYHQKKSIIRRKKAVSLHIYETNQKLIKAKLFSIHIWIYECNNLDYYKLMTYSALFFIFPNKKKLFKKNLAEYVMNFHIL